jgi:hypothetical protein
VGVASRTEESTNRSAPPCRAATSSLGRGPGSGRRPRVPAPPPAP